MQYKLTWIVGLDSTENGQEHKSLFTADSDEAATEHAEKLVVKAVQSFYKPWRFVLSRIVKKW